MTDWERARTNEQREIREKEILEAARKLLREKPYELIRFSDLASLVSFSRANIYKYYESKGEVYLAVLAEDIVSFSGRIFSIFHPDSGSLETYPEQFCNTWSSLLSQEKELLLLLSMAGTVLEKNCSPEILLKSKKSMAMAMENFLVPAFGRFLDLEKEKLYELLNILIVTANGLHTLCGLNTEQKFLLQKENLSHLISDFETDYKKLCNRVLRSFL